MRTCPKCGQVFYDDNDFCVDDGMPLVAAFDVSQSRMVVPLESVPSREVPTQFALPVQPHAPPAANNSLLYAVIGMLAVIIVGMGAYFYGSKSGEHETVRQTQIESSPAADVSPPAANAASPTVKPAANNPSTYAMNVAAADNRPAMNTAPLPSGFRLTRNFNQTFGGTADNDSITMRLQRSGSSLGGRVFSRRSSTEITVSGSIGNDGWFEMNEYSDINVVTGVYSGRIGQDGSMSGTWTRPDGSKPRSFYLTAK
ncbi:MAG: hypothetical protein IPN69_23585 [Acidobacteria bacterium]|nr:hypothetical protein [Acidobacteriota bacterium]